MKAVPRRLSRRSATPQARTGAAPVESSSFVPVSPWVLAGILALLVLVVYGRVATFPFLNYDDPDYAFENPNVRAGLSAHGIVWAFTSSYAANWVPLTWISNMADYSLFGPMAGLHHAANLLLHLASTLLLFFVLYNLTQARWCSFFVALVFAIHPLHVESVAWIAERKDALSGFFFLLALAAYVFYVRRPSVFSYVGTLALFSCAVLSKPMVVTFPVLALLMDYWPLGRYEGRNKLRPVLEKLPFFLIAIVVSRITYSVQLAGGSVSSLAQVPIAANVLLSYIVYLRDFIWPANLAVFYPYRENVAVWKIAGALCILAAISAMAWKLRGKYPYLFVGWFWYLIALIPVIGIVQEGGQSHADRYTYIPLIGISVIVAWSAQKLAENSKAARQVCAAALAIVPCVWATLAWQQVGYWRDSIALFEHAVAVTQGNYVAYNSLGNALREAGRTEDAISMFKTSLEIKNDFANTHGSLGEALLSEGAISPAVSELQQAVRLDPKLTTARVNLGSALNQTEQYSDAATAYRAALDLAPDNAEAHCGLGIALAETGRQEEAKQQLLESIRLKPDYAEAHYNLGRLLAGAGDGAGGFRELTAAVRLDPDNASAHANLGTLLAQQERFEDAVNEYRAAVKLDPASVRYHFNLGSALARLDRFDDAIPEFSEALKLDPKFDAARESLGYCVEVRDQRRRLGR